MTPPLPKNNFDPPGDAEESWVPIESIPSWGEGSDSLMETSDFHDDVRGPVKDRTSNRFTTDHLFFDLDELIAVGGFGEVWRGRQRSLGRVVALKRLRRDIIQRLQFDVSALRRYEEAFSHEAVIAASLEHPNIVPIHDLGRDHEGYPLLAMKLVRGKAWNRVIREELENFGEEYLNRHLTILESVAQAVAFAHSHGVIHRDIKPSQIMIGDFGEVQLMDWGLALRMDDLERGIAESDDLKYSETPNPGLLSTCGTIAFMAPEQASRQIHLMSPLTDIYLLGGTLYYLLTGKPPRTAETSREALRMAAEGHVIDPRKRTEYSLPEPLCDLAMRSLSANQDDRPPSVLAYIHELHDYLTTRNPLTQGHPSKGGKSHRDLRPGRTSHVITTVSDDTVDEDETKEIRPAALGRRASNVLETIFSTLFTKLSSLGRMDLLEESAVDLVDYILSVPPRQDEGESLSSNRTTLLHDAALVLIAQSRFDLANEALMEAERLVREHLAIDPESILHLEEHSRILALTAMNCVHSGRDHDGWIAAQQARRCIEKLAMEHERERWEPLLADRVRLEGFLHWKLGDLDMARTTLEEARVLQEQFIRERGGELQARAGLARTYNNLAWVYRISGNLDGAIEMMRRCHEYWCAISNDARENIQYRVNWHWSMRSLGLIHEHLGDYGEGIYWFETSLTVSRQLFESDPGNPQRRSEIAASHFGMGRNFLALGDLRRGEKSCRDAVEILGEVSPRLPEKGRTIRDYLGAMLTLGEILLEQNRLEEARTTALTALGDARRRRLTSLIATSHLLALEGRANLLLGKIHMASRHPRKSREYFEKGVELLKPIMSTGIHGPELAETWVALLLLLGKRDNAQKELTRLEEIHWGGREFLRLSQRGKYHTGT
ncbi:MAG: serine/threonine protein kinase [Candidatus Sumerlaeia bacterium]|nr:serine/threonine protein kinase [Candidatus Sumerlaeia bacterium]